MGGLKRGPLDTVEPWVRRYCAPLPAGVTVLGNSAVAPGCKLLARDGVMVATVPLHEPASGVFDVVIVAPGDVPAALDAVGRE